MKKLLAMAASATMVCSLASAQVAGLYQGLTNDGNLVFIQVAIDPISGNPAVEAVGFNIYQVCSKSLETFVGPGGIAYSDDSHDFTSGTYSDTIHGNRQYFTFSVTNAAGALKPTLTGEVFLSGAFFSPTMTYTPPPTKGQTCSGDATYSATLLSPTGVWLPPSNFSTTEKTRSGTLYFK